VVIKQNVYQEVDAGSSDWDSFRFVAALHHSEVALDSMLLEIQFTYLGGWLLQVYSNKQLLMPAVTCSVLLLSEFASFFLCVGFLLFFCFVTWKV
jgi:hypothetical protein